MLYYRNKEEMINEIKPDREKVLEYLNSVKIYEIGNVLVDVEKIVLEMGTVVTRMVGE